MTFKINAASRLKASKASIIADLQKAGLSPEDAKQATDSSGSPGGLGTKRAVAKKLIKALEGQGYKNTDPASVKDGQYFLAKGKDKIYIEVDDDSNEAIVQAF